MHKLLTMLLQVDWFYCQW